MGAGSDWSWRNSSSRSGSLENSDITPGSETIIDTRLTWHCYWKQAENPSKTPDPRRGEHTCRIFRRGDTDITIFLRWWYCITRKIRQLEPHRQHRRVAIVDIHFQRTKKLARLEYRACIEKPPDEISASCCRTSLGWAGRAAASAWAANALCLII